MSSWVTQPSTACETVGTGTVGTIAPSMSPDSTDRQSRVTGPVWGVLLSGMHPALAQSGSVSDWWAVLGMPCDSLCLSVCVCTVCTGDPRTQLWPQRRFDLSLPSGSVFFITQGLGP